MSIKLSPFQQRVFDVLNDKPNTDLPITDLWVLAYPEVAQRLYVAWESHGQQGECYPPVRDMQQELGPLFARINQKLTKCRIVPGEIKQTYRLDTINYRD